MVINFLQRFGRTLFFLFVGCIVLALGVIGVQKMEYSGASCDTPQNFGVEVARIYKKAIGQSLKVVPYEKDFIVDINSKEAKIALKKLRKIQEKSSQQLKKCAIGYFKLSSNRRKYARKDMYAKVREVRRSQQGQQFAKAVQENVAISNELQNISGITRYSFILPKKLTVKK